MSDYVQAALRKYDSDRLNRLGYILQFKKSNPDKKAGFDFLFNLYVKRQVRNPCRNTYDKKKYAALSYFCNN